MNVSKWKPLELNRLDGRPAVDQLVALRMLPSNGSATFYKDAKYDIGKFQTETDKSRKLWWCGTCGTQDPVRMKKHYVIWWCPVYPFDR